MQITHRSESISSRIRHQRFLCIVLFLFSVFLLFSRPPTHTLTVSSFPSAHLGAWQDRYIQRRRVSETDGRTDGWMEGSRGKGRIDERVKVKLGSTYYYYYRRWTRTAERRKKTHHHHDVYMCIVYQKPGATSLLSETLMDPVKNMAAKAQHTHRLDGPT